MKLRRISLFTFAMLAIVGPLLAQPPEPLKVPALLENMDGSHPILQPLVSGSAFTVRQRTINRQLFQYGSGAESIQLQGPSGQLAELAYVMPPAPVIQELRFRAHVLCSRSGVQLAARVVLPRTTYRATGRPFELLVRSSQVGVGKGWNELALDNLPQLLAKRARVARAAHGERLDEREAFVSQLVFLVPGGGLTELVVDQIQVFGVVNRQVANTSPEDNGLQASTNRISLLPATRGSLPTGRRNATRVPRIIQWQGESFEQLRELGFNSVGMHRLPTEEELRVAERLGISLVCPPPTPERLRQSGIDQTYDSVLAWDLGEQLSDEDLANVDRWEQLVSRYDPKESRPTVLAPKRYTLEASRVTDVLLLGRTVLGSGLTVREHTSWLLQRQRLARPGTPIWTKLETQLSPSQHMQGALLSANGRFDPSISYARLTALTAASLRVQTNGFYFQSHTPLSANDVATQRRSLSLALANMRLRLVEPWLLSGKETAVARSSHNDLAALVMRAERSHLLVPIWWSNDFQSTTVRQPGPVSFVVPDGAESSEAYLITLAGMQRVRHRRVTGGIRISLERLPLDGLILLSDDLRAISQVSEYLRQIAPQAAKNRRQLAKAQLEAASNLLARMRAMVANLSAAEASLNRASRELAACDDYLKSNHHLLAFFSADAVDQALGKFANELEHAAGWSSVREELLTSTPTSDGSLAFPDRLQLHQSLARAPLNSNLLAGGGFESLPSLLGSGWRHKKLPLEGITSAVRLSPEAPHSGSYCLELEARALDEDSATAVVPTAPVWISSAPLQVRKGDLIEITGVARLKEPIVGSIDGLQVFDSLGGPEMTLRIHDAPSWQPFRLIRVANSDTQLSVTIALSGLGSAQVDDVAVRQVRR